MCAATYCRRYVKFAYEVEKKKKEKKEIINFLLNDNNKTSKTAT
jgi:hypothetical protein